MTRQCGSCFCRCTWSCTSGNWFCACRLSSHHGVMQLIPSFALRRAEACKWQFVASKVCSSPLHIPGASGVMCDV